MRRLMLSMAALAVVVVVTGLQAADRLVNVTFRDFTGTGTTASLSNPPSTHPDFEYLDAYCWNVNNIAPVSVTIPFVGTIQICGLNVGPQAETGIVATMLGVDDKPVYVGGGGDTTNGATEFASWYNDDATYNMNIPGTLVLTDQQDGTFVFESTTFFPLDGIGFGNTIREKDDLPDCVSAEWLCNCYDNPLTSEQDCPIPVSTEVHNWHFTLEMHTQFTYQGGEVFDYFGDDDLWVFIDGRLVVDIGGVHNPVSRSIALDALLDVDGTPINLTVGNTYDFDLFFAERHRNESNFRVETSILIGEAACEGDAIADGEVNIEDLLLLLADWGPCPAPCTPGSANAPDTCSADTDRNCVIDINDLLTTLAAWGPCPGS